MRTQRMEQVINVLNNVLLMDKVDQGIPGQLNVLHRSKQVLNSIALVSTKNNEEG